jgi:hypothetical protein
MVWTNQYFSSLTSLSIRNVHHGTSTSLLHIWTLRKKYVGPITKGKNWIRLKKSKSTKRLTVTADRKILGWVEKKDLQPFKKCKVLNGKWQKRVEVHWNYGNFLQVICVYNLVLKKFMKFFKFHLNLNPLYSIVDILNFSIQTLFWKIGLFLFLVTLLSQFEQLEGASLNELKI